jgi:WD40 repeat protein
MEKAASHNDDERQESDATPAIPINVISHWILPFVQDRLTWNAVCSANKELHGAGMRMTPPWPETTLKLGQTVRALKFSPCGSFLASGSGSGSSRSPGLVHICDRHGSLTRLIGHTSGIRHLSFSSDGKHLASTGYDMSIRIWPTNSTRVPQQSDKKLRGHRSLISCLDFSPDDSNLLASGDAAAVKLWNVEQEVCIYSFNHRYDAIRSLCFLPTREERHTCTFVTSTGSLIRTYWEDLSGITNDIVDMPGLGEVRTSAFSHCGSLLAAASPGQAVTLYNMRTMSVVQRISLRRYMAAPNNHLAFSPDGKTLVFALDQHEIHICKVHDLNVRRRLARQEHAAAWAAAWAVAFDPSSQFLASAGEYRDVRLWTL